MYKPEDLAVKARKTRGSGKQLTARCSNINIHNIHTYTYIMYIAYIRYILVLAHVLI